MNYQLDAKEMFQAVMDIPENLRGKYISQVAQSLLLSNITVDWIKKLPKPRSVAAVKAAGGFSEAFEKFWQAYPRQIAKGAAYLEWQKQAGHNSILGNEQQLLLACLTALSWQPQALDWLRDNGKWIPHPATYLHQQRWTDVNKQPTRERYMTMDGTWAER
jgi:hypothetical protein